MKKSKNILKYSQPDFYKFSRDSIELAALAAEYEKDNTSLKLLDVFAGSGVLSIEFENRHKSVEHITFIEIQKEFSAYLEDNVSNINCDYRICYEDFKSYKDGKLYDVILMNPPYFNLENSRVGQNKNRNICRFCIDFEFKDIINFLESSLLEFGSAYICHRENLEHLDDRITRIGEYQNVGLFRFCLNID